MLCARTLVRGCTLEEGSRHQESARCCSALRCIAQVSQAVTGPPPSVLADSVASQETRLAALEVSAHTRADGLKV